MADTNRAPAWVDELWQLAARGERAAAVARLDAVTRAASGHREACEHLLRRAGTDGAAQALAEALLTGLALLREDPALVQDLAFLFQANRRWEALAALGEPLPREVWREVGLARFARGDHGRARMLLTALAQADAATDAEVLGVLGQLCEWRGEPAAALAWYARALAQDPDDLSTLARLGTALWRQQRDAEAHAPLTRAWERAPGELQTAGILASVLLALGQADELPGLFARALAAGAPWDARILPIASELVGEPAVFTALCTALGEFLPAPWGAALLARGQGISPALDGLPSPWRELAALPARRQLALGYAGRDRPYLLEEGLRSALAVADDVLVLDLGLAPASRALIEQLGARVVKEPAARGLAGHGAALRALTSCEWLCFSRFDVGFEPTARRTLARALQRPPVSDGHAVVLTGWMFKHDGQPPHPVQTISRHAFIAANVPEVWAQLAELAPAEALHLPAGVVRQDLPDLRLHFIERPAALEGYFAANRHDLPRQLAAHPDDPVALWHWGAQLLRDGRAAEGLALLERAREVLEAGGEGQSLQARLVYIARARALTNAGELAASLADTARGLAAFPNDPDLLGLRGRALLLSGAPERAIAPLQRALAYADFEATPYSYQPYACWLSELLLALACSRASRQAEADQHLAAVWAQAEVRVEAWQQLQALCTLLAGSPAPAQVLLQRIGATPP